MGTPWYTATVLRPLVLAIVLVATVTTAAAQPNPGGFAPNPAPPPGELAPGEVAPPQGRQYAPGEEPPAPGHRQRALEVRRGGPSGFWTSSRPAEGGAYRYRILGMGVAAFAITAFFVFRMLRRVSAQRPPASTRPAR